ncbi:hemagglutinin repeat-containing protein [Pseudomonas sichuanensis]|uniref:hemagglutinin repeat-containing protein n=1 Tax=Pseudomonas sichuanensis TaxID=2213015 RepID=UPI002160A245|nr:hemagglutinin repeat-containing protein [Pseudomonas sichuanensis]UVK82068.1 hemagglutinin repeat-containing protein [Pseudomonas sichuanensis]
MKPSEHPRPLHPDRLRWAMFLCLCASPTLLAAGPLQPAPGPGGTPLVSEAHGVPVIDIVAPNASGLSHNQFLDYNVGNQGLVLNNAVHAGQSQLAGALAANPQFQGQAASTILNEVISRNASLIEGPQEIFGRAADYILANPNGITLNGGSFINTTRAGMLVGTPVIEDQQLKYLDTLEAEGALQVLAGGQSNKEGALDLIAPRIESVGPLEAKGELNLKVGRQRLDAASGEVLKHLPGTPGSIDASLFGAMRAGRIRVLSSAEGAGVKVGDVALHADDGLTIRSAGDLRVQGTGQHQASLTSTRGALTLDAAGDLQLTATRGQAERIDARSGQTLTLDAATREEVQRDREAWDKKWWFVTSETYSRERTQTDLAQQGSALQASDDLTLDARDDLQLSAAHLQAGGTLALHSGADLAIDAAVDSSTVDEQVRHRKHLWRGDSDSQQYREKASPSTLQGAQIVASAGNALRVRASTLHSQGDLQLQARQVEVGEQALKDSGNQRDYRGDLVSGTFFGKRNGDQTQGSQASGSSLRAEGKLSVSADSMAIRGSTVSSGGDAVLYSDKASLTVEAAKSTRQSQQNASDSKVFGLLGKSSETRQNTQQVLQSDLRSTSNLRLASADELKVQGATLSAGQKLELDAKGNLDIESAQANHSSERSSQHRYLTASAQQTRLAQDGKPDSRQYDARVGYEVAQVDERQSATQQVASTLSGAAVDLHSGGQLNVTGSQVLASSADLSLQAQKVVLDAARHTEDNHTTDTRSGGGLALTGGIDRIGSAFYGHRKQDSQRETSSTLQRSELKAAGDLRIDTPHLATEAASVEAAGTLLVNAPRIDNGAAHNSTAREQHSNHWQGSLGASLEYRDISRPVERLVNGEEAARFQQPGIEDALAPPSVGADLNVNHLARTQTDTSSSAQASTFSGATVRIDAKRIDDQGTHYSASSGPLQIQADTHQLLAASDEQQHEVRRLAVDGGLRVDTSTGQDINGRLEGKGGTLAHEQTTTLARPGSLYGQTGIQVQLGSDGRYEGTRFNGGDGAVNLASTGNLTLAAAHDSTTQNKSQLDASLWAKGGNRPGSQGLDLRGYLDHSWRQGEDTKAQVAQVDAKGAVELSSASNLHLEGTRIDANGDITLHSDGLLTVGAASESHEASGSTLGGGLEIAGTIGAGKGGNLGGHFTSAKVDEHDLQAVDARFTSKAALQLTSLARDDVALQVQGLQASAARIGLDARNGGLLIEASSQQEHRNNRDITAGAGFKLNRGEARDKDVRALHGRVQVALDRRDNQTWHDSTLNAGEIDLHSRGDSRIEGARLDAERIRGKVGGDLLVASRKDRVDSLALKVDGRLSQEKNPQGHINAVSALAGPAGGKVRDKAGKLLANSEPALSPTLKVEVSHQQRDTVTRQTTLAGTQGIDLKVAGDTRLIGARLLASEGRVDLGGSSVTRETLSGRDYRRDLSLDASNSPIDLGTAVLESTRGKGAAEGDNPLDLGLLRTSGHSRDAEWASRIDGKP